MDDQQLSPSVCAEMIRKAGRVAALSGAGISTAAGIPDFRGPNGLYSSGRYDPDTVFSIRHFAEDPADFFRFSRDLIEIVEKLEPTFTHRFFAELEACGKLTAMITQNIDHLHQLAGSKAVLSVHGSYATSTCMACGRRYDFEEVGELIRTRLIPYCDCREEGVIKPDIVFFGEPVKDLMQANEIAAEADLFFVLGTSLVVFPAAMIPQHCRGDVVVVNVGVVSMDNGPRTFVVDSDLDDYFMAVAEALG